MPFVTGVDLVLIKAWQIIAMPDTCTLRTVTLTSDGSGGWTEGTSDQLVVPCRLREQGARSIGIEQINGERAIPTRTYILTVPSTYAITPQMRVIKGGVTFEVTSVNQGTSWNTATRAVCERVEA